MIKTRNGLAPHFASPSIDNRSSIYGDHSINSEFDNEEIWIDVKMIYQYNVYGNFSFEVKYMSHREFIKITRTKGEFYEVEKGINSWISESTNAYDDNLLNLDLSATDGRQIQIQIQQAEDFIKKLSSNEKYWTPEVLWFLGIWKED